MPHQSPDDRSGWRADLLPQQSHEVIYKPVSDGGVLLHTATEVYFGLNPVGARVWELLPPASRTLDELCGRIEEDFPGASREVVRRDVSDLLEDLAANALVVPQDEGGPPGGQVDAA